MFVMPCLTTRSLGVWLISSSPIKNYRAGGRRYCSENRRVTSSFFAFFHFTRVPDEIGLGIFKTHSSSAEVNVVARSTPSERTARNNTNTVYRRSKAANV